MIAVDEERPAVREFSSLSEKVLAVAGIYGPNASGKSNILDALDWLSSAVSRSLQLWDEVIPRDPFKFADGPSTNSSYEIEMMVDDIRYWYVLEVSDSEVEFEGLYSYPERRRRTLFERNQLKLSSRRGLSMAATRELLNPTTLALSIAMRFNEREVLDFGRTVSRISSIGTHRPRRLGGGPRAGYGLQRSETLFADSETPVQSSRLDEVDDELIKERNSALALLQFADLGIDGVQFTEESDGTAVGAVSRVRGEARRRLQFIHSARGEKRPFELFEESDGTHTWFRLIGPTLDALKYGHVVLMDEIDASLHPRLSARLLQLFQDPEVNPRGAQLIFTSHDTSLLNHLNRDEVWFTEKVEDASTKLTALAEYGGDRVRKSLNLEKAYLQGRFGAVPELDQNLVQRVLGGQTEIETS